MTQPAAILFDIDDTLCATTEFADRARRNAVNAMIAAGLKADPKRVALELEEVIREFSSNYEHHFDKLLVRLGPESIEDLNRALVVAAGVAAYHDTKFRELKPYPGVRELFEDLHALGTRLGIVTHGLSVKQAEKLVRLDLVRFLDPSSIFISDEVGINKPNPKLYAYALRSLDLPPERVLYVGDNPTNDIIPPRSLGMLTIWARMSHKHPYCEVEPTHIVESFEDLRGILRKDYGFSV